MAVPTKVWVGLKFGQNCLPLGTALWLPGERGHLPNQPTCLYRACILITKAVLKHVTMLKLKLQYFGHQLTHLKRPWCWERLKAGGEGDDRGWDGWMASPTQWTWLWVNSWSWWWTGRPGVLPFMGSQRVEHNWATELKWTEDIMERGSCCLKTCLVIEIFINRQYMPKWYNKLNAVLISIC